jgi:hypothetical protein
MHPPYIDRQILITVPLRLFDAGTVHLIVLVNAYVSALLPLRLFPRQTTQTRLGGPLFSPTRSSPMDFQPFPSPLLHRPSIRNLSLHPPHHNLQGPVSDGNSALSP